MSPRKGISSGNVGERPYSRDVANWAGFQEMGEGTKIKRRQASAVTEMSNLEDQENGHIINRKTSHDGFLFAF